MVTGPNSRTFSMPLQIKKLSILKNWSNIFGIFSLLMPLSEIGIAITEIGVFLYNLRTDQMTIAPVFGCGSSLFPQIDDDLIQKVMASKAEMNARVYDIPTSAIVMNKKRLNYFKLITSLEYEGCNEAVKRIVPRIDLGQINELIDQTEQASDLLKTFLKKILRMRKEMILDVALAKLI